MYKNKLELTWYGKEDELHIEPRILIEDPDKSNLKNGSTDNMLIHGDNLLALKALEKEYAGQIKCIYIDPPYNANAATDGNYDDNFEHSVWLGLMRERLLLLRELLSEDGVIAIQIDAVEQAYLKILLDEIFGRNNFLSQVCVKAKVAGVSGSNLGKSLLDSMEYILLYARDKSLIQLNEVYEFQPLTTYIDSYLNEGKSWKYTSILTELSGKELIKIDEENNFRYYGYRQVKTCSVKKFAAENNLTEAQVYSRYANKIFRTTNAQSSIRQRVIDETALESEKFEVFSIEYTPQKGKNAGHEVEILYKGNKRNMFMFLSDVVVEVKGTSYYQKRIDTLWDSFQYNNLTKEGNVQFPNGKKPEALIQRIIKLCSNENDIILDSFLGSGTTAAVAHKMGRKWIGIELGEQVNTHCKVRLDSIILGEDAGGITSDENWQGGGGYRFYELAPSLIEFDQYGEALISNKYNASMLAAAVAKHEGYTYNPDGSLFWKQSQSSEKSYLFVTDRVIDSTLLQQIHSTMKDDEFLLISCLSYDDGAENMYPNIKIKKIPDSLLSQCEFGVNDYALNIVNPPIYEEDIEEDE